MPDILIRMEMPKTCADCHDVDLPTAIAWLGAKCPWAHGIIDPGVYDLRHERHPDCPLHELPPHGDLIDLQAMLDESENGKYAWVYGLTDLPEFTKDLPVVVQAERRKEINQHGKNALA